MNLSIVPTIERSDEGALVVSSEQIAEGAGVQHKNVLELLEHNRTDFEEFGPFAFETRKGRPLPQGGFAKGTRVALLNEQQAMLLMSYQRNTEPVRAFKVALIKAFSAMAQELANPTPALSDDEIVSQALQITSQRVKALEAKVKADAPKVLFADSVAASQSTILVGELAKILRGNGVDIGQNRLYEQLREDGFLINRRGSDWNMPTQKAMDLGLFRIKETSVTHSDGHITVSKTTKVTGKGQEYFVNRYLKEAA